MINEDPDGTGPKLGVKTYFVGFFTTYNKEYNDQLEGMALASDWGTEWTEEMGNITYALYASTGAELKTALATIMNIILKGTYTRSAPVVSSAGDVWAGGYFEVDPFDYMWHGHFVGLLNPEMVGGATFITATEEVPFIDAAELLNDRDDTDRDIFTATLGSATCEKIDFTGVNAAALSEYLQPDDINKNNLTWEDGDDEDAELLIEFIRGKAGAKYQDGKIREWQLGAINRSSPVLVYEPHGELITRSDTYGNFYEMYEARAYIIYVGANDGMLHALFGEDPDGDPDDPSRSFLEESFAYIPPSVHENLKYLWQGTQWYYVDGSPYAADIEIPVDLSEIPGTDEDKEKMGCDLDDETCWLTYVLCGLRQGGRSYFTLEITDADTTSSADTMEPAPWAHPKWVFEDDGLGNTWSFPVIHEVHFDEPGTIPYRVVAIFGGGWSKSGEVRVGSYLYVINMENAQIIKKFLVPDKTEDPTVDPYPDPDFDNLNDLPGDPAVVDRDDDAYADIIYIGDMQGRVWKANLYDDNPDNWKLCLFYDTGDLEGEGPEFATDAYRRPVFYVPSVTRTGNGDPEDPLLVYFGTGHIEESDEALNEEAVNRVFAIQDSDSLGGCSYGTLFHGDTAGWPGNWSTWAIDSTERLHGTGFPIALQPGEKIMAPPLTGDERVKFYTYSPTERANVCDTGGVFYWEVNYLTGQGMLGRSGSPRVEQQAKASTSCYTISPKGDLVTFVPPEEDKGEEGGFLLKPTSAVSTGYILSWGEGLDFKL
jgi:type IV pilus assembly protein PilY1